MPTIAQYILLIVVSTLVQIATLKSIERLEKRYGKRKQEEESCSSET